MTTIVVSTKCPTCERAIDVECQSGSGFGHMPFHAVDCPDTRCRGRMHLKVPGPIVDVRWTGDAGPN
jgi:hypothetical protein